MKKFMSAITVFAAYLAASAYVLAAVANPTITVEAPKAGYNDLGKFITASIRLIFILAGLSVLIMLVWGALEWIFSGGEKEAVGKARNRIVNALIGLAVLAVAVALATVAGKFTGIDIFNFIIPTPDKPNP